MTSQCLKHFWEIHFHVIQARSGSIQSRAIQNQIFIGFEVVFLLVSSLRLILHDWVEVFMVSSFNHFSSMLFQSTISTIQNIIWMILTYFLFAKHGSNNHIMIGTIPRMNREYFIYSSFDFMLAGIFRLYSLKYIQSRIIMMIQNIVLAILIFLSLGLFLRNSMNLNILYL